MPSGWEKAPEYGGSTSWLRTAGAIVVIGFLGLGLANCSQDAAKAEEEAVQAGGANDSTDLVGVASVVDGDTIEIHGQRIRFDGIDTPEEGKRCGTVNVHQGAANALSTVIGTQTVHCTPTDGEDRYGRVVAQCRVGDTQLNEHLVEQGWARDWPRYSDGEYADEEAIARSAQRGVWSADCPADLWGERNYDR